MVPDQGREVKGVVSRFTVTLNLVVRRPLPGLKNCFHTTPLCSPIGAALLTGCKHHVAGTGITMELAAGYAPVVRTYETPALFEGDITGADLELASWKGLAMLRRKIIQ